MLADELRQGLEAIFDQPDSMPAASIRAYSCDNQSWGCTHPEEMMAIFSLQVVHFLLPI